MELDNLLDKVDGLDEVIERFILNLPENYDKKLYNELIREVEELEQEVNDSKLNSSQKLVAIGLLSSKLEYATALIETF